MALAQELRIFLCMPTKYENTPLRTHHKEAFDRIPDSRREKILDVGIDEFAEKGYEKANINVIAQKAGISIGLMYKYFSTKEDLFITCVNHGMEILDATLNHIMQSNERLLKKAEMLIRATCLHSRKNAKYIKIYNEISAEKDTARADLFAREIETSTSRLYIQAITDAQSAGDIRQDADPKVFAFFLDNLLTTLQFSYTCEYYRQRFRLYTGIDVAEMDDEVIIRELLKFLESAFTFSKEDKTK